jgi:hypothetical protein
MHGKVALLVLLGGLAAWLVYRNLLSAPTPTVGTAGTPAAGAGSRSRAQSEEKAQGRNRQQLSNLDPTLRLDVLAAARAVRYERGSRNIFQLYTPPPPPPPVRAAPAQPIQSSPPPIPPTPAPIPIPLKFYGVAQRPGDSQKKAFLTDTDNEILIAQVGDVVATFYRVIGIGVNAIELEDTRNQQRQQLPLLTD